MAVTGSRWNPREVHRPRTVAPPTTLATDALATDALATDT